MTEFKVLYHPTMPRRIIAMGFSWKFFFFGSLMTISIITLIALVYQVVLWVIMGVLGDWPAAFPVNDPIKFVVITFYGVGICLNYFLLSRFAEYRLKALLDKGYEESETLRGPTKDFVEAELAKRSKRTKEPYEIKL